MIKLYSFGPALGMPDPSPFVMKVDAWLRMSDIQFEHVSGVKNLGRAPKGKLPFIDDNGTIVADSQLIIAYLSSQYGSSIDEHLNDEQRAMAVLVGKSLDEHLYWCLVYSRWIDDQSWPHVKEPFFGKLPQPLKTLLPIIARRKVRRSLHLQGLGRHSEKEILSMMSEMLHALSDLLGDKRFLLGENPATVDATAFAFLSEFILSDLNNSAAECARSHENLVRYCERIKAEYYPEWH